MHSMAHTFLLCIIAIDTNQSSKIFLTLFVVLLVIFKPVRHEDGTSSPFLFRFRFLMVHSEKPIQSIELVGY